MVTFAHIVNPLVVRNPRSDLAYAQPITLESMRRAALSARAAGIGVRQFAATYPEDDAVVPDWLARTPHLEASLLDHVSVEPGEKGRKLPRLRDLLDRLHDAAGDAEFMIYSNIDIGLQPDFYVELARSIRENGWDALSAMRHTVSDVHRSVRDLDLIHDLPGFPQGGYSCMAFRRSAYPKYVLGDVCIGLQPVSVLLMLNMMINARSFGQIRKRRLCFHLGDDGDWKGELLNGSHRWNEGHLDRFVDRAGPQIEGCAEARFLLEQYNERRCGYVVHSARSRFERFRLKVMRRLGMIDRINRRYRTPT